MKLWLLLTLVFIVQEPISASAVVLEAYQGHYSAGAMGALFGAATVFDIMLTYAIGDYAKRKFAHWRWIGRLEGKAAEFSGFIGRFGKIVTLVLFVPLMFPLTGFVIPWLEISLGEAMLYILIGELIFWYGYVWLIVLGADKVAHGSQIALYIVLAVSIALSFAVGFVKKRMGGKKPKPEEPPATE